MKKVVKYESKSGGLYDTEKDALKADAKDVMVRLIETGAGHFKNDAVALVDFLEAYHADIGDFVRALDEADKIEGENGDG